MSTEATITPEQLKRAAALGFATHLLTAGVPQAKVAAALPKYDAAVTKRANRTRFICKSLLGGNDSKLFTGQ
jgi:hypothetical protein